MVLNKIAEVILPKNNLFLFQELFSQVSVWLQKALYGHRRNVVGAVSRLGVGETFLSCPEKAQQQTALQPWHCQAALSKGFLRNLSQHSRLNLYLQWCNLYFPHLENSTIHSDTDWRGMFSWICSVKTKGGPMLSWGASRKVQWV